jgi:hypothetical protein
LEDPAYFDFNDQEQRKAVIYFEQKHRISFKHFSHDEFIKGIELNHQALTVKEVKRESPPPTAPLIFLSYCHEDREEVERVREQLEELGIRVWLDRRNLRGGDDWDRLIAQVLWKVDYVIVVQSPHMQAQVESYVYKEIRIAIDRQQRFAEGNRFIIPVSLVPCDCLRELENLQVIELLSAGVQDVASAIFEDWDRPGRAKQSRSPERQSA